MGVTYEKVTPSERNSAFRVPPLTVQEVEGIIKDSLFHTSIKDDGRERTFRTRSYEAPFIPRIGSVDGNMLRLGLFPAFFGFLENVLNDSMCSTQDTTAVGRLVGEESE